MNMQIQEFVELNTFSTFMVSAKARYFCSVASVEDIQELITHPLWNDHDHYILGEGSNTLFISDVNLLVVKNEIKGLEVISEDDESLTVSVGAGENWDHFVGWTLDQKLWGVENLILIPGTVGASPVQNIGAYGVEVSDTIVSVTAVDTESGEVKSFSPQDCEFSYRDSIFKRNPGRYLITHVLFRLSKVACPVLTYDRVQQELGDIPSPTPRDVASAVARIRDAKLPRVGELGTAGSFFKNPIISKQQAQELQEQFPDMKQFEVDGGVKLSAAWLIDHLGFKGKREGNVGTYHQHALVLVNHGGASGAEVRDFAQSIITKVEETFGITLEAEINIID
jgi:UDP-N-acetylmuramate dehydrogenase